MLRSTLILAIAATVSLASTAKAEVIYEERGAMYLQTKNGKVHRGQFSIRVEKRRKVRPPIAKKPSVAKPGLTKIYCGGKETFVAPSMAGRFSAFCRDLVATGYKVHFIGGWRSGTCTFGSRHPCGGALDINQLSRNVCKGGCPRGAAVEAMARRHGLLSGSEWKHADAGHFERLDRHSLAQIDAPPKGPPLVAWSQRPGASDEEQDIGHAILGALEEARRLLVRTATVGGTMARQGPDAAMEKLHPVFAVRLSAAVAEARLHPGLERAGCFSAYRPPAFGVGGYRNKFDSNHAYGLACDMAGIGRPGSSSAKLWHKIATKHGLYNPYFGTRMTWEWNHYQVTPTLTAARSLPALRRTITAKGPKKEMARIKVADVRAAIASSEVVSACKSGPAMWAVADKLIDRQLGAAIRPRGKAKRGRARYAAL